MTYDKFFKQATGNVPYGYQCRLAEQAEVHGPTVTAHALAAVQRAGEEHVLGSKELVEELSSQPTNASPKLSKAEQELVADLVADGLSIQDRFRPEPLYQQTGQGHYQGQTVHDVAKAKRPANESQDQTVGSRSLAGNLVAGTAIPEERAEFLALLDRVSTEPGSMISQPS